MFDESRLDDERALVAADLRLRALAESGARVRREAAAAADAMAGAAARLSGRPRAVVVAGPDARLVRAVLEPVCPVPFVAWSAPGLPGWVGALDLVLVLAPDGGDAATASAVAEASRRGCQLVVACPASSLVAEHLGGDATVFPVETSDQMAIAVVLLTFLARVGLGPVSDPETVADALDAVATHCSPYTDISVNPAKMLAIALGDAVPLVWGGSALAARAARRVAEALRRASGRTALAGDAEVLLPVLESARAHDVFDDPFEGVGHEPRPVLLVLDDGDDDDLRGSPRRLLTQTADQHDVRVEVISAETGGPVARYAELMLYGRYAAEYLRMGLVDD